MSDAVIVAFITAGCALVGTLITVIVPVLIKQGRLIKGIREDTAASRQQVENDHGTNLRHDIDHLGRRIDTVLEAVSAVHLDMAWVRREQLDQARRLLLVEDKVA